MNQEGIIAEIKRTAAANGGVPLGVGRFFAETGIKECDWRGRYWLRWGDALEAAGFAPNTLQQAYDEDLLIERFIELIREVGRYPLQAEIRMKRRSDRTFPSHNVFNRFGTRDRFAMKIADFCARRSGFEDIPPLIATVKATEADVEEPTGASGDASGFVYLLKHGSRREYKIGRTYNALRREGEIAVQLPEKLQPVHYIETDDPAGIEKYWHNRFASKRKEGEWFSLTAADVRAFKRWKRII